MDFRYVANDRNGKRIASQAKAETVAILVSQLKNQGLLPLHIAQIKTAKALARAKRGSFKRGIKLAELVVITRQLATSINAGLILTEALESVGDDLENKYLSSALKELNRDIRSGASFSQALTKYPKIFPISFVAVAKAGEEGGVLGQTLGDLAKYLEDLQRLTQKIKSATYYPLFIVSFFILIASGIIFFIIPKFKEIYEQVNVQLPLFTRVVLGFSEAILRKFYLFILAPIVASILFGFLLKSPKFKLSFDRSLFKIFLIGKLIKKAALARFCRTLAILLSGGVGLIVALPISSEVTNNAYLKQLISDIKESVLGGSSLNNAFKNHKFFPNMLVKMILVGEKTGNLSDMLRRNSEYYEQELEASITGLTSIIEPTLIVSIGLMVAAVAIAFYLPIFQIANLVK